MSSFAKSPICVYGFFIINLLVLSCACQERNNNMPNEVATLSQPATSPSGNYLLKVINVDDTQPNLLTFQILDRNNMVLYTAADNFDDHHTTFFLWDDDDRVWVYSGDLGTFFWEQDKLLNSWQKYTYAQSDVAAPAFLKEVRPRWHQQ